MAFRDAVTYLSELIADVLRTGDAPDRRIVIESTGVYSSRIQFYSGNANEVEQAYIYGSATPDGFGGDVGTLRMQGPRISQDATPQATRAKLDLDSWWTPDDGDGVPSYGRVATLDADRLMLMCQTALGIVSGRPSTQNLGIYFNTTPQCFDGTDQAFRGTAPPKGQPKLIKQGTIVANVNASGFVDYDYSSGAFPNGIVSVILTVGDNTPLRSPVLSIAFCTLLHLSIACYQASGAVVATGTAVRINYIAIGW